jgi:hypothetical protein
MSAPSAGSSAAVMNGGGFAQQQTVANIAELVVWPGYELRLVSLRATPTVAFTEGEQFNLTFGRGGVIVAEAASAELGPSQLSIACFIGASVNAPRPIQQVVATGLLLFTSSLETATMPIPDIWWDRNVRVTLRSTAALTFAATAIWEMRPLRKLN